jgi:hypothetical protein
MCLGRIVKASQRLALVLFWNPGDSLVRNMAQALNKPPRKE